MKPRTPSAYLFFATILMFFAGGSALAASGIWLSSPASGDWNTAANWSTMTVPNGPADTATFDSSSISDVSISADTQVNEIAFDPLAHLTPFTITVSPTRTLSLSGVGIINNSGVTQSFVTAIDASGNFGTLVFSNNASAGSMTRLNNEGAPPLVNAGGLTQFQNTSTAGSATINNDPGKGLDAFSGLTLFKDASSAGSAMINNKGADVIFAPGGFTQFGNTASAGNATINNNAGTAHGGDTMFKDRSTAASATINNDGAPGSEAPITFFTGSSTAGNATINNNGFSSDTEFQGSSSAGSATITNNASTVSDAGGGKTTFGDTASADGATIINNGATVTGDFTGGRTVFFGGSAGHATLIANGGSGGGVGGRIEFWGDSTGGTPRVELFGNGSLDISERFGAGQPIGSIEGSGNVFLGANQLIVGSNNLSTVFSGVIQDGGFIRNETGGSLTKIGRGTFTLSGANTYTGDTTVNGGVLQVEGSIASPNTFVNRGGTLSGTGTVRDNVSNGGIVAPGDSPGTLHVGRNYSQSSSGVLEIEIANLFSFDQLMISGTATLSGTLDVTLDGYTGHTGDIFTILTSSGLSGNFSILDLPTLGDRLFFTEGVTSNDVLLTVHGPTGVSDQGSTLLLMMSAISMVFGTRWIGLARKL